MANFPLSPFRQTGNIFYVSGQIGQKDGELVSDNIAEQTAQAIENIAEILKQNNLSLADIMDMTAFITDQNDYSAFNEAYRKSLPEPFPSRTTVTVTSLPLMAKVELKAVAFKQL